MVCSESGPPGLLAKVPTGILGASLMKHCQKEVEPWAIRHLRTQTLRNGVTCHTKKGNAAHFQKQIKSPCFVIYLELPD